MQLLCLTFTDAFHHPPTLFSPFFQSNFATVDDATGIVTSRRADRHFEELGPVLCTALNGCQLPNFPHYQVNVRYATEHRCGVVVRGPGLSGNISGTDPLKDNLPLRVAQGLDGTPEADHTARVSHYRAFLGQAVRVRKIWTQGADHCMEECLDVSSLIQVFCTSWKEVWTG